MEPETDSGEEVADSKMRAKAQDALVQIIAALDRNLKEQDARAERRAAMHAQARAGRKMIEDGLVMLCEAKECDGPNRLPFFAAIHMWKRYQASRTTRHIGPM